MPFLLIIVLYLPPILFCLFFGFCVYLKSNGEAMTDPR